MIPIAVQGWMAEEADGFRIINTSGQTEDLNIPIGQKLDANYGTGDLLINISVYIPEKLTETEKSKIKELAGAENFQPSPSIKNRIFNKFRDLLD